MKSLAIIVVSLIVYYTVATGLVKMLADKRKDIIDRKIDEIDRYIK